MGFRAFASFPVAVALHFQHGGNRPCTLCVCWGNENLPALAIVADDHLADLGIDSHLMELPDEVVGVSVFSGEKYGSLEYGHPILRDRESSFDWQAPAQA